MPECVLRRAAKIKGTRYPPGTVVDVSDEEHAQLVRAGVAGPLAPAAPPPTVRIPRTAEEKQAALAEAQARAKVAGG